MEEDFCNSPWAVPTAPGDLIGEIDKAGFAMLVGQGELGAHVGLDGQGRIGLHQPAVLAGRVHFPQHNAVLLVFLGDALAPENLVLHLGADALGRIGPAADPVNQRLVLLVGGVGLVGVHAQAQHVDDVVRLGQILGVVGDDQVEGVDGLEADPLVLLVPDGLADPPPVKKGVVDDGNDLVLEIAFLAHLVVEPPLGGNGDGGELLAHRDKAGKNVVANGAVDEAGFELLNGRVDELYVKVGGGWPRLYLTTHTEVAGLVEKPLAGFPGVALAQAVQHALVVVGPAAHSAFLRPSSRERSLT